MICDTCQVEDCHEEMKAKESMIWCKFYEGDNKEELDDELRIAINTSLSEI